MDHTQKETLPSYFLSFIKHIHKSLLIFNNEGEIVHFQKADSGFPINIPLREKCLLMDVFKFDLATDFQLLLKLIGLQKTAIPVLQLHDGKKIDADYEQFNNDYHILIFENENFKLNRNSNITSDQLVFLELILESNAEAIQVADKSGRMVYMNHVARERLGLHADKYQNFTVFDFSSFFQTPQQWQDDLSDLKNNGIRIVEGVHTHFVTKENYHVEITVVYRELNGEPYSIATIRDISKRKHIENELLRTNRLMKVLNSAIDSSSLVTETDIEGNISYANKRFSDLTGYSQEELIGQNHSIINSGIHSNAFWADFWQTIKMNNSWSGEICNKTKDGLFYWVKTLIYPVLDEKSEVLSFLSVQQDITEEKKSKEILRNTVAFQVLLLSISNRFVNIPLEYFEDALIESLNELGEFFEMDRSFVFDYNHEARTCSRAFEWSREPADYQIGDLQNMPFEDISEWTAYHFKNELINLPDINVLDEGNLKQMLQARDIKSVLAIPMLSVDECVGFIGFASVSKKKQFEEQDILILKLFAEILVNVQSRIKSVNQLTTAKEEIERINQNLELEVFEKSRENSKLTNMLSEHDKLALLGEIAAGIAHDMNTPLGSIKVGIESIRYVLENLFKSVIEKCSADQMHFACQRAMTKEIKMVIGGIQSIKETASILEYITTNFPSLSLDSNSLATAFIKARIKVDEEDLIAHIIASENPLDYLDLFYHIQTIRNLVDTIIASGDKASSVVSNLRNYLQNSSSEEQRKLNLKTNIQTILTVFAHELQNKVEIYFDIPDLYILGFENKLYQLWSNIIKNSIEALEGGGVLNIIYIEKPEYHSISFQNNGPKIDEEVLKNMFKKFYTTKAKQSGTGLGLSIVKRIINEHNGHIVVTSTDSLTTFEFMFPK